MPEPDELIAVNRRSIAAVEVGTGGRPPETLSLRAHPPLVAHPTGEAANLLGWSAHSVPLPAPAVLGALSERKAFL
ncbi:hypothetical protein [Streptomyces sp. NPDC048340]|uniref:hypothetical protein n=1 Tax=Streptomyces sp. NPDC048340 TaxID=3365537 RepID=UPI003723EFEE